MLLTWRFSIFISKDDPILIFQSFVFPILWANKSPDSRISDLSSWWITFRIFPFLYSVTFFLSKTTTMPPGVITVISLNTLPLPAFSSFPVTWRPVTRSPIRSTGCSNVPSKLKQTRSPSPWWNIKWGSPIEISWKSGSHVESIFGSQDGRHSMGSLPSNLILYPLCPRSDPLFLSSKWPVFRILTEIFYGHEVTNFRNFSIKNRPKSTFINHF